MKMKEAYHLKASDRDGSGKAIEHHTSDAAEANRQVQAAHAWAHRNKRDMNLSVTNKRTGEVHSFKIGHGRAAPDRKVD